MEGCDIYRLKGRMGRASVKTTEIYLGTVTRSGDEIGNKHNGLNLEGI